MNSRPTTTPFLYLMPALLLEFAFVLMPVGISIYYSLHRVRFYQIEGFSGLTNYIQVLTDPTFLNSLAVTAFFCLVTTTFTFAVGFGMALLFNNNSMRNIIMRTVVLLPYVIAMLVGSMLLKWLLSSEAGLVPLATRYFGLNVPTILASPELAMGALIANGIWRDSAFAMILLMAGLKSIPPGLISAAQIDGASPTMIFREIILPLLRPAILITLVRLLLHFANVLTFALILTGGGPNGATETIVLKTYRTGFMDYDLGRANAMSIILTIFNMIAVAGLFYLLRNRNRAA